MCLSGRCKPIFFYRAKMLTGYLLLSLSHVAGMVIIAVQQVCSYFKLKKNMDD